MNSSLPHRSLQESAQFTRFTEPNRVLCALFFLGLVSTRPALFSDTLRWPNRTRTTTVKETIVWKYKGHKKRCSKMRESTHSRHPHCPLDTARPRAPTRPRFPNRDVFQRGHRRHLTVHRTKHRLFSRLVLALET